MCEIARVMGERETAAGMKVLAEERITRASGIYLNYDTAKQTDEARRTNPPAPAVVEETST